MPTNKGALIRRQVLDGCLSSNRNYSLLDLMERCNEALREHGFKPVTSENTIRTDLREMGYQYPEAEIVSVRRGRNIYYRYKIGTPAKSCVKNFRDREKTRILAFTERCKYERDPVYYFGTVYSAAGV